MEKKGFGNEEGFRWGVLVIAWATYFAVYAVRVTVPPLSPFIVDELHLSNT